MAKGYYEHHKEEIKAKRKLYLAANKEKFKASRQQYWIANRDRILAERKARNATLTEEQKQESKERQKVYHKRYKEKDPERCKAKNKRANAKPKRKAKMARWHQENRDRRREQQMKTRPALIAHYKEVKQNNGLLTAAQAAPQLGISARTLSQWLRLGKIPHIKSGQRYYIKNETIDEYKNTLETGEITVVQLGRRLETTFVIPRGFTVVKDYEEFTSYALDFADTIYHFLLVCGPPGNGKSQTFRNALGGRPHKWIDNHASPVGVYCAAYTANDAPIVLDDVNHFLANRIALPLMKALTQTDEVRHVSWESPVAELKHQGVPREYDTRSNIVFIANWWNVHNIDMEAIQSRADLGIAFFPERHTIHEQVGRLRWCPADVYKFVERYLPSIPLYSMRTYRTAMTFKKSKRIASWKDHCLKVWGLTQVP
jgi:excisionase family DNA binding protein